MDLWLACLSWCFPAGTATDVCVFCLGFFLTTKCAKGVDGWCDAFRRVEWQTSCVDSALVFWTFFLLVCFCCSSEATAFLTLCSVTRRSPGLRLVCRTGSEQVVHPTPLYIRSRQRKWLAVCRGSSEGDLDFIYEYIAWSFLIFNKETLFSSLFPIFSFYVRVWLELIRKTAISALWKV